MRIGGPARKHGVPDADIWHGVRNATHKIDMDDDLTMLIGPARDGAPLELGVLGLDSDDPVISHALPLRAASGEDHGRVGDVADVVIRWQRRQWVTGLRATADRLDGHRVERGQPAAPDALEHFGVCVMGQNPRLAGIGRHLRPAQNSVNLSELPIKAPGVTGL
jgi:hypothetical protein